MKDEMLASYQIKNNFRKYHALIGDIISHFSNAPWFLPLMEIKTFASEEVLSRLNELSPQSGDLVFTHGDFPTLMNMFESPVAKNPLFDSGIRKERRMFDWRKLLTMEIGKKKA